MIVSAIAEITPEPKSLAALPAIGPTLEGVLVVSGELFGDCVDGRVKVLGARAGRRGRSEMKV